MNVIRLHPRFPALGTPQEQEAFAVKYKQTMDRIRACNEEARGVKEQVRTKRIEGHVQDYVPTVPKVCQAVNMNNTPCRFRATCGRFCKKHKVTAKDLDLFEE